MLSSKGGLDDDRMYGFVSRLPHEVKSGIRRHYGIDLDDNSIGISERLDVISQYCSENIAFFDRQERQRVFGTLASLAGRLEKLEAQVENQQRAYKDEQMPNTETHIGFEPDSSSERTVFADDKEPVQPNTQHMNYLADCVFDGPKEKVQMKTKDGKMYRRCLLAYDANKSRGERAFDSEFLSREELRKRGCPIEGENAWKFLQPGPFLGTIFGNHPKDRCFLATGEWVEMD